MGGLYGTRQARTRRNRAGEWRGRDGGPARRPDRQAFGCREGIATARNAEALRSVAALGADVTIPLVDDEAALEESFRQEFAQGVDVVIDYLWGKSADRLLIAGAKAGNEAVPIRFVQIGSVSGPDITLPSAALAPPRSC